MNPSQKLSPISGTRGWAALERAPPKAQVSKSCFYMRRKEEKKGKKLPTRNQARCLLLCHKSELGGAVSGANTIHGGKQGLNEEGPSHLALSWGNGLTAQSTKKEHRRGRHHRPLFHEENQIAMTPVGSGSSSGLPCFPILPSVSRFLGNSKSKTISAIRRRSFLGSRRDRLKGELGRPCYFRGVKVKATSAYGASRGSNAKMRLLKDVGCKWGARSITARETTNGTQFFQPRKEIRLHLDHLGEAEAHVSTKKISFFCGQMHLEILSELKSSES